MEVNQIILILQLSLSCLTLGGILFAIYKYFRDPDIKADKTIDIMKAECVLKHQTINTDIHDIKINHLNHIESDVRKLQTDMARALTILEILEKRK